MGLYEDQFSPDRDIVGSPDPTTTIIVASTPRSGSHMLARSLIEAGAFGVPLEYCNEGNLLEWKRRLGTSSLEDTIAALKSRRTSLAGVFSIKLHYRHLAQFGSFRRLLEIFPNGHFIRLERRDLLRQAISYAVARQTGVWIDGQRGNGAVPEYSCRAIDECLRDVARDNASWSYDLAKHGCRVLHLNYEGVRSDIARAVAEIANFVGITEYRAPSHPLTRRQSSNTQAAEWASRYLAEANTSRLFDEPMRTRGIRRILGGRF